MTLLQMLTLAAARILRGPPLHVSCCLPQPSRRLQCALRRAVVLLLPP
jgi:hypothetical protein